MFFGQSVADRVHPHGIRLASSNARRARSTRTAFLTNRSDLMMWADSGSRREPVEALAHVTADNLFERHCDARIELRLTPSVLPFWQRVTELSSVEFSGHGLRNASRHHGDRSLRRGGVLRITITSHRS